MDIQNLVRDKIIGNVKIGTKKNGLPQKLPYFNVEKDKATSSDMVEIFKQLYPGEPTKLKIKFISENPFNFKYKRYIKNGDKSKIVCIGNGTKAIKVDKDEKGKNKPIEVKCSKDCEYYQSGKCKLSGNIKFVLDGIEAGGVWKLATTCGISISNIAYEIIKYKKAKMSIVDVPFELTLNEMESLYGPYYIIDLHGADMKPHLVNDDNNNQLAKEKEETPNLLEENSKAIEEDENKTTKKANKKDSTNKVEIETNIKNEEKEKHSNIFMVKSFMPTIINGEKFDKIIFNDNYGQDVEYILHPKADQKIISLGVGTIIEINETKIEMNKNILCKYKVKQIQNPDGSMSDYIEEEYKKAV